MPAPRNESSRPVWAFLPASSSRWETSSGSESAGSRSSGRSRRTRSGMSRKRSSIDETPMEASRASWSEAVSERERTLLLFEKRLVGGHVEEPVGLGRIAEPDLDEPPLAVRVVVDLLRLIEDDLVHLDDLTRERGDEIGDGLHRFDLAVAFVGGDRRPLLGRLEMDELAERVLRVRCGCRGGGVAVDTCAVG